MTKRILAGLFLTFALAACGALPVEPTTSPLPEEATSTFTPTPPPPTETPTPSLTPTATETPLPTDTPTPVVYGPTGFPENVNPLTGMVVADPSLLDRRPVAIKVNIVPRYSNRPPWGLSLADIVYDYYHNAGYTRFFALFYGNDADLVGPIRSGRMPDHELVQMYQANFAYGSADELINQRLLNASYSNRLILEGNRSNCPPTASAPLCRYEPSGVDFLLGSTSAITSYIRSRNVENGRQNLDGMYFDPTPPLNGSPASQLYVRYSGDDYMRWDYDAASNSYLRFQDNVYDTGQGEDYAALTDRLNDEQISAENVVVILARHEYYQQPPNEIVEILLSGTGTAYAFRDGQVYQVTWNRPTTNSVLTLTNADGTPFPFHPGNTWFQVVGISSVITQPESDVWRFSLRFP